MLKVTDFGTDEEWAAKSAAQQRRLLIEAQQPLAPQLEAPVSPSQEPLEALAYQGAILAPEPIPAASDVIQAPSYVLLPSWSGEAPVWRPRA